MWNHLHHNGPYIPSTRVPFNIKLSTNIILNNQETICFIEFIKKFKKQNIKFKTNFWRSLLQRFIKQFPQECKKTANDNPKFVKIRTNCITRSNDNQHGFVVVDNKRIEIPNNKMEYPHIFIGRGNHPLSGTCKFIPLKKYITINASTSEHSKFNTQGFKTVCNQHATWICSWKDPITSNNKYISFQTNNDNVLQKFELARKLKKRINKLHNINNTNILLGGKKAQLALAVYLIEHLCIRVGHEKDSTMEAETIGCCTLEKKHISITSNKDRLVQIEFPGKDSIPFCKTITLPSTYFSYLKRLLLPNRNSIIFSLINPNMVNRYLDQIMSGLTAKVFRTYKASITFQKVLIQTNDLKLANKKAATLCNHKKSVNDKFVNNLTTSRHNYIDPRIYFSFIKRNPTKDCKWFPEHNWAKDTVKNFRF